ncbi:hypothetical protein FXO37_28653 [Capsicum annuum]|nr:hypothetical protein FXO37_28653 [Capsicum annuum]
MWWWESRSVVWKEDSGTVAIEEGEGDRDLPREIAGAESTSTTDALSEEDCEFVDQELLHLHFAMSLHILNKLTPGNFDLLKGQLLDVGITRADILKGVISLIFDKAALEPTFCPMYAQLCSYLNEKLPPFPSTDEPGGEEITFEHVLLNTCDEAYEVLEKLKEEFMQMTAPEQESERKDKKKLILSRALGNKMLMEEFIVQDLF